MPNPVVRISSPRSERVSDSGTNFTPTSQTKKSQKSHPTSPPSIRMTTSPSPE